MQETPRHISLEIKLLLSQYLDGALEAADIARVEALLSAHPHYVALLDQLQTARDAIRSSLSNQEQALSEETLGQWSSIARRLEADQQCVPGTFEFDFVSAYYDGEISATDPEYINFESQLYQNVEANEMLASVGEVSDALRQWGARLETSCTVDLTESVMAQLQSDQAHSEVSEDSDALPVCSPEVALLSAYVDQALSPREVIEANRLIESDIDAKLVLTRFNELSAGIESVSSQIQAQAPDLGPAIMAILSKPSAEGGLIVATDRFRQTRRWAKVGGLAAASVLLVTFLSSLNQPSVVLPLTAEQPVAESSQNLAKPAVANMAKLDPTELASVPVGNRLETRVSSALPAVREDVRLSPNADDSLRSEKASPRKSERFLEGFKTRRVAARPQPQMVNPAMESQPTSPSSDEYLFNALNEQTSGEDVSSIFGK